MDLPNREPSRRFKLTNRVGDKNLATWLVTNPQVEKSFVGVDFLGRSAPICHGQRQDLVGELYRRTAFVAWLGPSTNFHNE